MFMQLLAVLCLGLVASPAESAPSYTEPLAPAIAPSYSDPLAPVFGKRFKLDHCDDIQGLLHSMGLSDHTAILLAKKLTIEERLVKFGDEFMTVKDVDVNLNGVQRKFVVQTPFRLGEEMEKQTGRGRRIKYTVTRDGNTFTKVWSTEGLTSGATVTTFSPEEVKSTIKIKGGAAYHCVYKPVCSPGDLDCDNEL